MSHDKELADQGPSRHHQHEHHPVVGPRIGEAVVVAQHRKQHGQGEVGVVHAALFAAFAVNRVNRLASPHGFHYLALARNNPEENVGTHRRADHGTD